MRTSTMDEQSVAKHSRMHSTGRVGFGTSHYSRFAIMVLLSFISMYILMYAMVDSFSSVFNNINQVYMAGLMAAPMAIIEILLMRSMYQNQKLNAAILVVSILALLFFWSGIRNQIGVGDQQFLRSMIPHHSGAILMCSKADLKNQDLRDLCTRIIADQQKEINQMRSMLAR